MNFLFTENEVSDDLINLIRPRDLENIEQFGGSLTGEQYNRNLMLNGRILKTIIRLEGESADFDLNFHFNVRNLVEFKAGISETSILELKQEAIQFITEIYNLELEG